MVFFFLLWLNVSVKMEVKILVFEIYNLKWILGIGFGCLMRKFLIKGLDGYSYFYIVLIFFRRRVYCKVIEKSLKIEC